ncbi:class I lanthipeptide [Lacinutrix neustonica]|uniref:Class I lanthipeptide n=1 Tax=Lacinutrix neustonica TaxID=2980107 RepID=A0A9E8MTF4_9FLAO|nr:class I lanthipeptide [Lacinutrix neustonica]WAC01016.1 class I lanthipeptide [Lacinutrix neustonica]
MKTQNTQNKLDFRKGSVTELSDQEILAIEGGTAFAAGFAIGRIISKIIQ